MTLSPFTFFFFHVAALMFGHCNLGLSGFSSQIFVKLRCGLDFWEATARDSRTLATGFYVNGRRGLDFGKLQLLTL